MTFFGQAVYVVVNTLMLAKPQSQLQTDFPAPDVQHCGFISGFIMVK